MDIEKNITDYIIRWAKKQALLGNYELTLKIFDMLNDQTEEVKINLIKAKVFAQQKKYREALLLWQKVLKKEPNNREALQGIKKIKQINSFIGKFLFTYNNYFVVFVFVIGLMLLTGIFKGIGALQPNENSFYQKEKISEISLKTESPIKGLDNPIPGIRQIIHDNTITIVFKNGIFYSGNDKIKPEAIPVLHDLAFKLKSLKNNSQIKVIGFTDDLPLPKANIFVNNDLLALARAYRIIRYFCIYERFPVNSFSPSSMLNEKAPYPNNNEMNRKKNRTVVFKILVKSNQK